MEYQNESEWRRWTQSIFSKKLEAFTLVEVIFTLIIIGFLVYMAMPDYSSQRIFTAGFFGIKY